MLPPPRLLLLRLRRKSACKSRQQAVRLTTIDGDKLLLQHVGYIDHTGRA